ncbi:hypothetical protein [Streptomyces sp. BPTC-684]|uniref:hypothetical protein n=1 Tax=Streptomyces sp. BPTC-684 TaxID=3043734 RepID=UPI0024B055C2|nr:hypothetical protein [Streptomyces sp. BPTC-684]WHM36417.1 hypothetical protein QIY60_05375 [Streptomyces sp. BPTC-684]
MFAALALAVAVPTSAHAATGTFTYVSPESGELEMDNPTNGECRLLLQGATKVLNGTDGTAVLFCDRGCEEQITSMAPGESRSFGDPIPRSVMFN